MRRTQVLSLAIILLAPALIGATPTPTSTPTKTIEPPIEAVVNLPEGQKPELMEWRPPTVEEMKRVGAGKTDGLDALFTKIIIDGMKAQGITVSSVEYSAVGNGEDNTYRWVAGVRNEKGEIVLPQKADGSWMEWANYFTLNPDKSYSFATKVNGQAITYAPVPGSQHSTMVFEGDKNTGDVQPVLVKQPVPTTDKGVVYSQYADMTKAKTEWKQVEGLGKVTNLPEREKTLESAVRNGWWWANVDGKEKWVQDIVRNEKGEIPLEDGITIKLIEIKHVQGGKLDFTERSGLNPLPDSKFALKDLPSGYEYTALFFEGFNAPENSMRPYGPKGTGALWLESGDTLISNSAYNRTTPGDKYTRFYYVVPHKIGDELGGLKMSKFPGGPLHSVYSIKDPFTLELQPK
jgi:hypothetical protein